MRIYIQRGFDFHTIFFRPGPDKGWIAKMEEGSESMFVELENGEGAWYDIVKSKTQKEQRNDKRTHCDTRRPRRR